MAVIARAKLLLHDSYWPPQLFLVGGTSRLQGLSWGGLNLWILQPFWCRWLFSCWWMIFWCVAEMVPYLLVSISLFVDLVPLDVKDYHYYTMVEGFQLFF